MIRACSKRTTSRCDAVLEHLERCGATTRVRVNGARQHPDVGGLVMAVFRQATSREDDPQLHTHVVISTKVQTPDGRWMALDARYLKRKQRALGGLYQSVLRAELTHRYGVGWGPIEHGQAEIAGMPPELLDVFSKRTAQVDAALADKITEFRDREGRDPSRWERAALTREAAKDTRAAKTQASTADVERDWHDEAAALGWTPTRLTAALRAAARGPCRPRTSSRSRTFSSCSQPTARRGHEPMCCERSATSRHPCRSFRDTGGPRWWSRRVTECLPRA